MFISTLLLRIKNLHRFKPNHPWNGNPIVIHFQNFHLLLALLWNMKPSQTITIAQSSSCSREKRRKTWHSLYFIILRFSDNTTKTTPNFNRFCSVVGTGNRARMTPQIASTKGVMLPIQALRIPSTTKQKHWLKAIFATSNFVFPSSKDLQ